MNDKTVILNVHITAAAGQEDKLADLLLALVAPTRKEPGCLTYELHRATDHPGRFMFYERFASQAALEEHLASPYFQAFVAFRTASDPDPVAESVITTWRSMA